MIAIYLQDIINTLEDLQKELERREQSMTVEEAPIAESLLKAARAVSLAIGHIEQAGLSIVSLAAQKVVTHQDD